MRSVIQACFLVSVLMVSGVAWGAPLMDEDFNTDPGWTSTVTANVNWDSNGYYRAYVSDSPTGYAQWGYSPVFSSVPTNTDFTLTFDIRTTSTSGGTYPQVALIQHGAGNPTVDNSLKIEAHYSDAGFNKFMIGSGENGIGNDYGFSPTFDTSTWYRHTISYDSTLARLDWEVVVRDTGTTFHSASFSEDVAAFDQIAIGYQGVAPVYGSWAEIYVDNISVVPEPASMALLALGGLAMLRRRK